VWINEAARIAEHNKQHSATVVDRISRPYQSSHCRDDGQESESGNDPTDLHLGY